MSLNWTHLPLAAVESWQGNPRKHFDKDKLQELAESIRSKGVLQPILVRRKPLTDAEAKKNGFSRAENAHGIVRHRDRYQIAAGERRWRAAQLAGLTEIPAVVRDLSDRDMLEVAVVENDQREDVSPLERADGYAALVEQHGVSVEELATKIGRSVSTVRNLLRLRQLPDLARRALDAKLISPSVAGLIARVPSPACREEAAIRVLTCDSHSKTPEKKYAEQAIRNGTVGDGDEPMGYRDAREMVHRRFQVELKQAPFDQRYDQYPGGSCETCPKRAGNDPELTAEGVRADVCTDPECYRSKVQAHSARLLADAEVRGQKVLSKQECKDLFNKYDHSHLSYDAPWVDLAAHTYEAGGYGKTWKKLVGKQLAGETVLAVDEEGVVHELVPKAAAMKLVKTSAHTGRNGSAAISTPKEDAKHRAAQKLQRDVCRAQLAELAEATHRAFSCLHASGAAWHALRCLVNESLGYSGHRDEVFARRNCRGNSASERTAAMHAHADTLDAAGLAALLAELRLGSLVTGGYGDSRGTGLAKALGLSSRKEVERRVKAEQKARKAGRSEPSANGHAAAKGDSRQPKDTGGPQRSLPAKPAANGKTQKSPAGDGLLVQIGTRVRRRQEDGRLGWVTGIKKVPDAGSPLGQQVSEVYVEWDLLPDEQKRGGGWWRVEDLVVVARAGSPEALAAIHATPVGRCKVCFCTEDSCPECIARTGTPCTWVSPAKDLCSACNNWRALPLENLEIGNSLSEGLLKKHGILYVGQLAHRLATSGDGEVAPGIGLKLTKKLRGLVALVASDDDEPDPTFAMPADSSTPVEELELPPQSREKALRLLAAEGVTTVEGLAERAEAQTQSVAEYLLELPAFAKARAMAATVAEATEMLLSAKVGK